MTIRFADLPDDILFHIFALVETARDLGALALCCRRLCHLVTNDAWPIFVRNRFPSLAVPGPAQGGHSWRQLAESLTWQSRCWDRRSLQFHALLPHVEHRRQGIPQARAMFMAVVDAHYDPASQEEVVVWGAGEHLMARHRERRGRGKASATSWHKQDGHELGFNTGYDDITSVKIVRHNDKRAVLAARHNGHLSLLSAEPDRFGECIASFRSGLESAPGTDLVDAPQSISCLDVLEASSRRLLAAATKTELKVYDLPKEGDIATAPATVYDLKDALESRHGRLCNARWMENGETMALAVIGCKDTLRYLSLTPTGWSHHVAAKNERVEREFSIKYDNTICPNSLEPVHLHSGTGRGTSLLLSSWRDGTIRLQDLRTPSPFDAVYQDNVDPWSTAEALMAYGTERFIAGGGDSLTVQVFDFRWTRDYYHTAALPCLDRRPFPRPHQPFMKATPETSRRARCDHVRGLPCTFHGLCNSLYYRPNAKFFLSASRRARRTTNVWSMARGSDLSPNFYVGTSGGVIEANLEQTPGAWPRGGTAAAAVDPNFGFADWRAAAPAASGYRTKPLVPALMETGDGYSFKGNDRSILLPGLAQYQGPREWTGAVQKQLAGHHRLDVGYQHEADFAEV